LVSINRTPFAFRFSEKDKPITIDADEITTFTISTDAETGCPVPLDKIGGANTNGNGVARLTISAFGLLVLPLIARYVASIFN